MTPGAFRGPSWRVLLGASLTGRAVTTARPPASVDELPPGASARPSLVILAAFLGQQVGSGLGRIHRVTGLEHLAKQSVISSAPARFEFCEQLDVSLRCRG